MCNENNLKKWQIDFFIEHYKHTKQFAYLSHRTAFIVNGIAATTIFAFFDKTKNINELKQCIIFYIIGAIFALISTGLAFIFQHIEHKKMMIQIHNNNNYSILQCTKYNNLTNMICGIFIVTSYICFLYGAYYCYKNI